MSDWNLIENTEKAAAKVHTKAIDMSLNELADMYKNGELIIQPDYQRNFRWSEEQQSRFIESLVLELPIPAIYVIETKEGIYELIDGLQRISSYLHYRGVLPAQAINQDTSFDEDFDEEDADSIQESDLVQFQSSFEGEIESSPYTEPLTLVGCDIVNELNGFTEKTMPQLFAIRLKRMPIRVEVIKKDTDPSIKYHLFKRLNTGGETLSDQEVRNCTIRLLDSRFINFIMECARNKDFIACTALPTVKIRRKYDHEVVLRFFAFKNSRDTFVHNIDEFLTKYLENVTSGLIAFNYEAERSIFESTFREIRKAYQDNPPSAFSISNKRSINVFDAFTQGIQFLLIKPYLNEDKLREVLNEVKLRSDFKACVVGGGLNTSNKLKSRIEIVENNLREAFDGLYH